MDNMQNILILEKVYRFRKVLSLVVVIERVIKQLFFKSVSTEIMS